MTAVAGAILGGYGALIGGYMLKSAVSSSPPAPEPVAVAPAASTGTDSDILPASDSPDFEKFIESDVFNKFVENEESVMKWVGSLDKWISLGVLNWLRVKLFFLVEYIWN